MFPNRLTIALCALAASGFAACAPCVHAAPQFLDDAAEPSTNVAWDMPRPTDAQTLIFDYKDAKNFYALDLAPDKATFSRTVAGASKVLSSAPVKWNAKNEVVLQRRPWLMQLVVDDDIALRSFDATFDKGKIGAPPADWGELRVQPLEPVRFDDDFTRAAGQGDELWKTVGKWQLSTSSEHISQKNASMSSNPFAYQVVTPNAESLATTGRWFWDSYDARTAVRPGGAGQVGVAAYVKDAKNYLAFRWSSEEGESARQLVRVTDGVTKVLAQGKGAFLPKQWYQLGLRTSPGYVEAILDGVPVLRANNEALGQGGVGLWAKNMDAAEFDDVQVRSYDFLRTAFADNGAWERATGKWDLANGVASGQDEGGAGALLVTGARDWDGYRAHISAQLKPGATLGYAVGVRDAKNYTAFEIAPDKKARIVRVTNGTRQTLFEGATDLSAQTDKDGYTRFQIDARNGGLRVKAGDQLIAQASAPNLTNGRFGLIAQSATPLAFKDAVIYFPPPPAPPTVATKMEDDPWMVGWASASGDWPPTPGADGLEFWNVGELFGDTTLDFPWKSSWQAGNFDVALRAKRGEFNSGYLLRGTIDKTNNKLDWKLMRGDKTLAEAPMPYAALPGIDAPEGGLLHLQMAGNGLMLLAGETPILSYLDPNPPTGTALAVRSSGFRVRTEKLAATTANRDDYTFTEAPVDFYAPSGRWNVFSRWPCYGDWSFFGGTGRHPTLWSKRTYGGDVTAEFYAHPQMDLPKEPGYSHPGDLNVSLCGDGKNPASGYSFIIAGDNNTATKIMRGDKVVAERTDDKATFHNTINHNMNWHRAWFYIRAATRATKRDGKDGVLVSLKMDAMGQSLDMEYFDADPLPLYQNGGRVAFWTLDSTMMIARARIEAEKMGTRSLPAGLIEAAYVDSKDAPVADGLAPVAVVETDIKTAIVAPGNGNWTITNPVAGGIFAVDLNRAPLTATPATKFSMNASIPAGVKVDLYAMIDGQWHTIAISGDQKPDPMAPTLGAMKNAGNAYSFDIGAALTREFPGQKEWKVDTLRLGAMQGNPYRWIGFDGNDMNANYRIANLSWK